MRWIAVLLVFFGLTGFLRAAGPDDEYLDIYNEVIQADNLQKNGHNSQAATKYLEAQTALKRLKAEHPTWNTDIVAFRLDYVSEQLQAVLKPAPVKPVPAPEPVPTPAPVTPAPAKPAMEVTNTPPDTTGLMEQIRTLTAANDELGNKLKEALSVQPAAVSPRELAKAEEKITALQKENDLLRVSLEQSKTTKSPAPSPEADKTAHELAETKQALADLKARSGQETEAAQAEIQRLKKALDDTEKKGTANNSDASLKDITAERDKLKADLAARTRDLADAESRRDLVELRTRLAVTEQQRDELKTKLAAAPPKVPAAAATDAQTDQLRARLAVLEAQPLPYTPEELALLNKTSTNTSSALPTPGAATKHVAHTNLPPGAVTIMTEAARAEYDHDFAKAAAKYQDILRQDENNVYVLSYLAKAQFLMNQLDECEKTVKRALAIDPEDAPSLYLLGILRFRQQRLDEALDALSLSAKYNPTNSGTQNYLGCVLADKGLRPAAETAFRKAVVCDPNNAEPHFNLAFVYAEAKPPSLEMARWHYKKALELGHPKSQELEHLLDAPQSGK
jgi:Flp pilus assembly protein TadD